MDIFNLLLQQLSSFPQDGLCVGVPNTSLSRILTSSPGGIPYALGRNDSFS